MDGLESSAVAETKAMPAATETFIRVVEVRLPDKDAALLVLGSARYGEAEREQAGAIELWCHEPAESKDLLLDDGYHDSTSSVFEFISRRTAFRKGHGLSGLAWGEPGVSEHAAGEAGGVGASARAAGLRAVVALPVLQGSRVVAVVAWYF